MVKKSAQIRSNPCYLRAKNQTSNKDVKQINKNTEMSKQKTNIAVENKETAEIQSSILKLQELGQMPDESNDDISSETIDGYADLLDKIETPVNYDEAKILVNLFPEDGLYGVEWALLHKFETVFKEISEEKYLELIAQCSSIYWRETLLQRFSNADGSNKTRTALDELDIQLDGQIEIFYHNSQKYNGIVFEDFNNCMTAKFEVKNGVKNGIEKTYFESGKVKSISEYKNGLLDGLTVNYSEEGGWQKATIFEYGICTYYELYDEQRGGIKEKF